MLYVLDKTWSVNLCPLDTMTSVGRSWKYWPRSLGSTVWGGQPLSILAYDNGVQVTCEDDLNECAPEEKSGRRRDKCPADSTCVDIYGGYTCVCETGKTCTDFDQCATNGGGYCPVGSTCTEGSSLTDTDKGYTCECDVGWKRNENTQECESPCPSTTCWDYDNDSQTCTLKQTCMELTCDYGEMIMGFNSKIFGFEDPTKISPEPTVDSTKADGVHFTKTCTLGECGMTYETANDGAELQFKMVFEPVADPARRKRSTISTFTMGEANASLIKLNDGVIVNMVEYSSALTFTCTYPMNVTVSTDFAVAKISLGTGMTATGNFGGGFTLSVDKGTTDAIPLGTRQTVRVDWSLTTLAKVKFHFAECNVEQNDSKVALIKNNCYSNALKVTKIDGTATQQSFSYQTFSTVGASGTKQTMSCTLNLCFDGTDCKMPTDDAQCLKEDETKFAGYKYTVGGYFDMSS